MDRMGASYMVSRLWARSSASLGEVWGSCLRGHLLPPQGLSVTIHPLGYTLAPTSLAWRLYCCWAGLGSTGPMLRLLFGGNHCHIIGSRGGK